MAKFIDLETGLPALWAKVKQYVSDHAILTSAKGANGGVAELDSSGKVPSSQLPSYVDDVVEYANVNNFPVTGESGKIYVDTSTNTTYRWSGSTYIQIGGGGSGSTDIHPYLSNVVLSYSDLSSSPVALNEYDYVVAEVNPGEYSLLEILDDHSVGDTIHIGALTEETTVGQALSDIQIEVNRLRQLITNLSTINTVTLYANSWTLSNGVYTQSVSVYGITANSLPEATINYGNATMSEKNAIDKSATYLTKMETGAGTVTFYALSTPTVNITIQLKGV